MDRHHKYYLVKYIDGQMIKQKGGANQSEPITTDTFSDPISEETRINLIKNNIFNKNPINYNTYRDY